MNSSKQRRSKKAAAAGALLLAVMLAASACGNNDNTNAGNNNTNAENQQQNNVNDGPVVDQLPDQSGIIEPDISSPTQEDGTASNENSGKPADSQVIVDEGVYTGLADSHSIEIETKNGAIPLQITEDLAAVVDQIPSGANVKFQYTEKAVEGDANLKQNWLVKIEEIS